MDSFKQTDIGLIPEDWDLFELANVTKITSGGTPSRSKPHYYSGSHLWIKSGELEDNFISDSEEKITDDAIANSSAKIFPPYTVLLAMYGATVGKTAIMLKPGTTNQAICAILPNPKRFIPDYLRYYLMTIREEFLSQRYGGAQPNISQTIIKNTVVPLPSLPEQKKIAHILSKIQQAIESQEQIIKTTQELKKALMQKLFTEGLNGEPQKQTEIGLIPESWDVVPLKDAVSYIDYGLSEAIPKNQDFEGVRNVSTADINREGKLLYYKVRKVQTTDRIIERLKLKDGDVLFNWRNSPELIGKTTIYLEQPETHIFASFILRIRCDEVKYHNYFLAYLMNHYREQGVFIQLSRRAVNQANYNRNEIYVLKIPMPSLNEQVNVANAFRKVDKKIELLNIVLSTLKELFSNLLNQLMTGQIRVKDIEFKLEEV